MSSPNSAEPEEVAEMAALAHLTALFADTDLDELVIEQPPADLWAAIAAPMTSSNGVGLQAMEAARPASSRRTIASRSGSMRSGPVTSEE